MICSFLAIEGGIKVCKAENKLIIAFWLTQKNVDFYKQEFSPGKRKPMGFEIEIIDYNSIFSNKNIVSITSNLPSGVRYDESYVDDDREAHTLAISNPSKLSAEKWYIVTFHYSKHNEKAVAHFEAQVQLVANLFELKNSFPEKYGKYSFGSRTELNTWFYGFNLGNPSQGNSFFNIRIPEGSTFDEGHFFEGVNSGYDRVIWDFSATDNTKDYEPYCCGWGSYPIVATNPSESEDTQTGDEYSNLVSSVSNNSSGSSSKPDLYVKELKFKDGKTKYYDDENIIIDGYVKNSGKSVSSDITKIAFKLYRFRGEKENGDTKEVGKENIKGSNLKSGTTKHEEFSGGAPDDENKYQFYAVIDTKNAVNESNEGNNRSPTIVCRVHKRPDIRVERLTLTGNRIQFEQGESISANAVFTNLGGETFVDIPVRWYLDGVHFANDNMRHWNIENGDRKNESVNLTQLIVGTHVLRVHADFAQDKNSADNYRELIFEVVAPVIFEEVVSHDSGDISLKVLDTKAPIPVITTPVNPPISETGGLNSSHLPMVYELLLGKKHKECQCKYFQLKKISDTGGKVSYQIIFRQDIPDNVGFVGQRAPKDGWIAYPVLNRTVTISNWSKGTPIEFSVYYWDSQGEKQWLAAELCPKYFNNNPNPEDQHFLIYLN